MQQSQGGRATYLWPLLIVLHVSARVHSRNHSGGRLRILGLTFDGELEFVRAARLVSAHAPPYLGSEQGASYLAIFAPASTNPLLHPLVPPWNLWPALDALPSDSNSPLRLIHSIFLPWSFAAALRWLSCAVEGRVHLVSHVARLMRTVSVRYCSA
jgi:hypothetical protein